ncbi:MAG: hypothetical protein QOJ42_5741 [Acidobacteriaceae bacterium]|nr:hypothetical protein [Acidobacteriaceae bacterium]
MDSTLPKLYRWKRLMASRYAVSASLLPASSCSMRAFMLATMSSCAVVFCSAGIGCSLFMFSPPGCVFLGLTCSKSRARIAIKNNMLS